MRTLFLFIFLGLKLLYTQNIPVKIKLYIYGNRNFVENILVKSIDSTYYISFSATSIKKQIYNMCYLELAVSLDTTRNVLENFLFLSNKAVFFPYIKWQNCYNKYLFIYRNKYIKRKYGYNYKWSDNENELNSANLKNYKIVKPYKVIRNP